ncbi:MAG: FtsH protease activity modulator HflK [Rhizomicrobium sp.]
MPWNEQNETGDGPDVGRQSSRPRGKSRGPWGAEPPGGDMRPSDLDELLARLKKKFVHFLPEGGMGPRGWTVAGLAVVVLWLLSGFYIVSPYEQGVVLRFGKFIGHTGAGVNYHLPWPIETAYTPEVTRQQQINIGYKVVSNDSANGPQTEDVPDESLMLTGDENIVDINFTVFWQIKDANAFLFNVDLNIGKGDDTVKAVAESAMREVVGQEHMDLIMTSDREQIQVKVRNLMQKTLDAYNAGIIVTDVKMQKADPPMDVREAYLDVQKALADQDRKRNEAEAYANTIIPQARGEAAQIVQDAEAYRARSIAEASGEAQRFLLILHEYKKAPDVTKRRMYYETMSQVLAPMNKVIVDDAAKGVVPYFQLPPLSKSLPAPRQGAATGQASGQTSTTKNTEAGGAQ